MIYFWSLQNLIFYSFASWWTKGNCSSCIINLAYTPIMNSLYKAISVLSIWQSLIYDFAMHAGEKNQMKPKQKSHCRLPSSRIDLRVPHFTYIYIYISSILCNIFKRCSTRRAQCESILRLKLSNQFIGFTWANLVPFWSFLNFAIAGITSGYLLAEAYLLDRREKEHLKWPAYHIALQPKRGEGA